MSRKKRLRYPNLARGETVVELKKRKAKSGDIVLTEILYEQDVMEGPQDGLGFRQFLPTRQQRVSLSGYILNP